MVLLDCVQLGVCMLQLDLWRWKRASRKVARAALVAALTDIALYPLCAIGYNWRSLFKLQPTPMTRGPLSCSAEPRNASPGADVEQ